MIERTNEELKDELLRVYRYHFSTASELERYKNRNASLIKKLGVAEAAYENERRIHETDRDSWHRTFREMDEENVQLTLQVMDFGTAVDATLDLVGAVLADDAEIDSIFDFVKFGVKKDVIPFPPPDKVSTVPLMGDKGDRLGAARCLSCNGEKGFNFYICEECFEIQAEYGLGLFEELSAAWDDGQRDFPREGKNAKLIASEPRDI
jgi:hypothetical protein